MIQASNQILYQQVLVLNASYEPIHICGAKRAIVLIVKGVAKSEEDTSSIIRSPSVAIKVPAVIRLVTFVKLAYRKKSFSKRNIFLRDRYTCQYCGKKFDPARLTLDHVVPQSRGGKSSWENLVACCRTCNEKKGDRTPLEAGMNLQRQPKSLGSYFYLQILQFKGREIDQWKKYLFC